MDDNVAVIGVGLGKVGEHWEKSLRDLAIESIGWHLKIAV